jgi:hypothetical protein
MAEASSVDPRVGMVLQDRYRTLDKLADGSMGAVYRAERLQLGRRVAIKFLHASYAKDANFIQRFERETVVMSRLAHPHCVSVIDFGVAGAPYVVMEFVAGRTLRSVIEGGRLPVDRSVHIARQVLAGLAHAHSQGIVHRDIKPANIMLTEATGTGEHVRILDFGLATVRDAQSNDLSQTAIVVGTPNYMSPEQSMATKVDGRSDIYSTGIVLFEMLTGQKPYNAEDTYELLLQHRSSPIPRLTQVAPGAPFPVGLQEVIERALAKEPQDRYGNAIEFSTALDAATSAGTPVPGSLSPVPPPPPPVYDGGELPYARTQSMASEAEPRRGGGFFRTLILLGLLGGAAWAGVKTWQARAADKDDELPPSGQRVDRPVAMAPDADAAAPAIDAGAMAVATPDAAPAIDGGAAAASGAWPTLPEEEPVPEEEFEVLPEDEQDEPVEAVPDDTDEVDQSEPKIEPEPEPEPVPPLTPRIIPRPKPIDTVAGAVAAIRAGKREEAIRALQILRKKMPKSAYVPYLLGNLYMEKRWWTVGIDHYRAAIKNNRVYRGKRILNQNLVRALASPKTRRKAAGMFIYTIGKAALPYLRRAAKSDRNPSVRRQAAWLAKRIKRRR